MAGLPTSSSDLAWATGVPGSLTPRPGPFGHQARVPAGGLAWVPMLAARIRTTLARTSGSRSLSQRRGDEEWPRIAFVVEVRAGHSPGVSQGSS